MRPKIVATRGLVLSCLACAACPPWWEPPDFPAEVTGVILSLTDWQPTDSGSPTSNSSSGTDDVTTTGETTHIGAESSTGAAETEDAGAPPFCGDGHVDPNEECDAPGDLAACNDDCTLPRCGDGDINFAAGELCDDGNTQADDACVYPSCLPATCGDGIIHTGVEECDGAGVKSWCDADCTFVSCGDGVANGVAGEHCDDGGDSKTCDEDCTVAVCGDGYTNAAAGEACDDDNLSPGDTCSSQCEATEIAGISAGDAHVCVVFESGRMRCWGANDHGQLGDGFLSDLGDGPLELPTADVEPLGSVDQAAAGGAFTCALLSQKSVRCWGDGSKGSLGDGNTMSRLKPGADVVLGASVEELAAGREHICARRSDGAVLCWGSNTFGQLGQGHAMAIGDGPGEMPPATVTGLKGVKRLASGAYHTCALTIAGEIRCWGKNTNGQLGRGDTGHYGDAPGETGPAVVNLPAALEITAGGEHTCARLGDKSVRCWGANWSGQLGYGDTINRGGKPGDIEALVDIPLTQGDEKIVQISAGSRHTCALLHTGVVRCWGGGVAGQLGLANQKAIGDGPGEMPPSAVDLLGNATRLTSGGALGDFNCAQLQGGRLRCWGANTSGQLGLGHQDNIGDNEHPSSVEVVPF